MGGKEKVREIIITTTNVIMTIVKPFSSTLPPSILIASSSSGDEEQRGEQEMGRIPAEGWVVRAEDGGQGGGEREIAITTTITIVTFIINRRSGQQM